MESVLNLHRHPARVGKMSPAEGIAVIQQVALVADVRRAELRRPILAKALPNSKVNFAHNSFVDRKTPVCIIPPNSFALARTVEYFRVPRDVLVICLGKSTYARCGIIVNVTPLEP